MTLDTYYYTRLKKKFVHNENQLLVYFLKSDNPITTFFIIINMRIFNYIYLKSIFVA